MLFARSDCDDNIKKGAVTRYARGCHRLPSVTTRQFQTSLTLKSQKSPRGAAQYACGSKMSVLANLPSDINRKRLLTVGKPPNFSVYLSRTSAASIAPKRFRRRSEQANGNMGGVLAV